MSNEIPGIKRFPFCPKCEEIQTGDEECFACRTPLQWVTTVEGDLVRPIEPETMVRVYNVDHGKPITFIDVPFRVGVRMCEDFRREHEIKMQHNRFRRDEYTLSITLPEIFVLDGLAGRKMWIVVNSATFENNKRISEIETSEIWFVHVH